MKKETRDDLIVDILSVVLSLIFFTTVAWWIGENLLPAPEQIDEAWRNWLQ